MVHGPIARLALLGGVALMLAAPVRAPARDARAAQTSDFPNIGYATWSDVEPEYRLFPGDAIDIAIPSAPELDRSVVVQPDGRVTLPLIGSVMAADRSAGQLEEALAAAYAPQLLHPEIRVTLKAAGPLKVFVGGEVGKPGVYDMEGDMDALRAIIDAGGFTNSAKRTQVVIIRRGPGGRAMMRTVDLKRALHGAGDADLAPLRRFDIVYVPKSSIAEAGQFVQQYFRDLIPGQIGFNYSLGGQTIATGVP
jgi:polysaccharide export outer membrane protein